MPTYSGAPFKRHEKGTNLTLDMMALIPYKNNPNPRSHNDLLFTYLP
jgi:hypothetical protein